MSYERIVFVDNVTPLNAQNFNHIESGIVGVEEELENTSTEITTLKQSQTSINATIERNAIKLAENTTQLAQNNAKLSDNINKINTVNNKVNEMDTLLNTIDDQISDLVVSMDGGTF